MDDIKDWFRTDAQTLGIMAQDRTWNEEEGH